MLRQNLEVVSFELNPQTHGAKPSRPEGAKSIFDHTVRKPNRVGSVLRLAVLVHRKMFLANRSCGDVGFPFYFYSEQKSLRFDAVTCHHWF